MMTSDRFNEIQSIADGAYEFVAKKYVFELLNEVRRICGTPPVDPVSTPPSDCVEVRIAVGVDRTGDWACAPVWKNQSDEPAFADICETLYDGEARYIVTASLPKPVVETVVGRVEAQ